MNERGRSQSAAPLFRLAINQLAAYDFLRLVSDGIHAPNPLQRILCFELFCNALGPGHLPYHQIKLSTGLSINLPQVIIQFAGGEKIGICNALVLLQPAQVPLAPNSHNWLLLSFSGNYIVISLQLILQACSYVCWTCQEKCSRETPKVWKWMKFETERSVAEWSFKFRRMLMRPAPAAFCERPPAASRPDCSCRLEAGCSK